jgi:hypothetical protein
MNKKSEKLILYVEILLMESELLKRYFDHSDKPEVLEWNETSVRMLKGGVIHGGERVS